MGEFFNFSLWDVIGHPVLKAMGKILGTGAKAATSANAKTENEEMTPAEISEIRYHARAGDSNAQVLLAVHYAENQEFELATYWLEKSAEQGNEHALGIIEMLQEG